MFAPHNAKWVVLCLMAFGSGWAPAAPRQDPIEVLKRQIQKDPKSAELYYNLGVRYHHADRMEEAAAAYLRAIELKHDFYKPYYNLGAIRASQGRFREAVDLFVHVQKLMPGFEPVRPPLVAARLFLRADSALGQRRFVVAAKLFEEYLRLNPGDRHAAAGLQKARTGEMYERAVQAQAREQWQEAMQILRQLDSSYADVEKRLAEVARQLRLEAASEAPRVASREPTVRSEPDRPELEQAYQNGVDALDRGDFLSAIAALRGVVGKDRDYRDAAARLRTARNRLAAAIDEAYERGLSHLKGGRWRAAEDAFRRTLALAPRHARAQAGRLVVAGRQALADGRAVEAQARALAALQLVARFAPADLLRRDAESRISSSAGRPTERKDPPEPAGAPALPESMEVVVVADSAAKTAASAGLPWVLWVGVLGATVLLAGAAALLMVRRRRAAVAPGTAPYVSESEVASELLRRQTRPSPTSPHAARDLADAHQLGRYELRGEVGRGAMGIVYKAWDPKLDRTVVLKTIRFDVLSDLVAELTEAKERFFREARAAGRLNHPNIVTVYDVAEEDNVWFIVMEYLQGETMAQLLARERVLAVGRVAGIIKQVCSALEFAHSQGVIHRDIKPSNIMVLPGDQAKVMDFGIAKLSASTMTTTGSLIGTASYMSPEQISGRQVDGRSDIFSTGIVAYELLTGQRPFQGETIPTLMYEILNHQPTPPTRLNPSITPAMNEIVGKALAKDPDQRYSSARELHDDLVKAELGYLTEAIMVVDICDSSRIAEKYGNRFAERLFDQFRAIADDCLERHRPTFVKDTGDGLMVTFASGGDAVRAAIEFQRCMAGHNGSVSEKERIHTRVGIHFGETRVTELGDRHSADVNIAFRVQGLSRDQFIEETGGLKRDEVPDRDRIFVTQQVYEDIHRTPDWKTRDIGFFEMKNIYGRHKIYEVVWEEGEGG